MFDYLGGLKPMDSGRMLNAMPSAIPLQGGSPATGAPPPSPMMGPAPGTTDPAAAAVPAPAPPPVPAGPIPAGVFSAFGGPAFLPPSAPTPDQMNYLTETQADGSILLRVKNPDGTPGPVLQVLPTPKQVTKSAKV